MIIILYKYFMVLVWDSGLLSTIALTNSRINLLINEKLFILHSNMFDHGNNQLFYDNQKSLLKILQKFRFLSLFQPKSPPR